MARLTEKQRKGILDAGNAKDFTAARDKVAQSIRALCVLFEKEGQHGMIVAALKTAIQDSVPVEYRNTLLNS